MIPQFDGLNDSDQQLLTDAIPLITTLIAGADGDIDTKEKEWAAKIMEIRGYKHPTALKEYYQHVGETFAKRLDDIIASMPSDMAQRNQMISDELAQLNEVFPKMEQLHSALLYKSFTSFAEHVAKASGGFLGFAAISREEARFVDLPMVNAVELPADYKEEDEEDASAEEE